MSLRSRNIDGGWAWVILVCSFLSFILNGILAYSMGIITEAMLEVFEGDLSLTSAVGSAVVGAQCCIGPLAGYVSKRFGCRACAIIGGIIAVTGLVAASLSGHLNTVFISGIVTGVGFGLPLTSCSVIVGLYFHKLRSIAAGIASVGAGFGIFVGPPLVRYLIDQYGLHGNFLILAGLASHFCVIGSLLRPLPGSDNTSSRISMRQDKRIYWDALCSDFRTCHIPSCHVWRNRGFLIYLFSAFLWSIAESACLLHLPNYCIQQGSSKTDTALLFTAMGVSNIISRLLMGFAANAEDVDTIALFAGQLGLDCIFTGLFPLCSATYGGQLAYSAMCGLYSGGLNCLYTPIVVRLVGLDDIAVGLGLASMASGIGYLAGPPVAGAIVDYGATYRESYLFAASVYLLASLSALMIPLFHSKEDRLINSGMTSLKEFTISVEKPTEDNHDTLDQTPFCDSQTDTGHQDTEEALQPLK